MIDLLLVTCLDFDDYTKDRHAWLDDLRLDDIAKGIEVRRPPKTPDTTECDD